MEEATREPSQLWRQSHYECNAVKLLPCSILCPWPRLTDTIARVGAEIYTTGVMGGNIISYLAGAVGGSCVLLEKKSRRIELALYVMQKVVDALLSLSAIRVRIPAPNIVFASLALMSWSHCNFSYEDALRKSYRSAFRKLFDGRELHSMFIS